jgi:hypothetical protein
MTMRRAFLGVSAAVFLVALVSGCSSIRSTWKEYRSNEIGREGWWRGDLTPSRVEGVRHGERVMIFTGDSPGEFKIKICPKTLTFPVPPAVLKVVSVEASELNAEVRAYAIPEGWTWERIHEWYVKWFDFKPTGGDR